jgi:hypothetical protein
VAVGGVANDILKKTSSTDYATEWETPTSTATASAVVRRDASGGAAFVALTGTGNWSTTGHFLSNPSTSEAGHFLTKNGTTPTIAAGRSAWFSSTTGAPQFKNGTGGAVTLIYNGGPLGTPSSGTLTSCTGLPVTTGISGLGTNVAAFLATPTSANLRSALTDETGTGAAVFDTNPTIVTPKIVEIKNTVDTTILNTDSQILSDSDGFNSVDFGGRLLEVYGAATLDWANCNIIDITNNSLSVNWDNRILYHADGSTVALDWANSQASDSGGDIAIDWFLRSLLNGSAATLLDWTSVRNSAAAISFDGSQDPCLQGIIKYYNGFVTAGNGLSAIRGVHDSAANAAAKTATTLYAVPVGNGGTYRISFVAKVTRAASTSSVLGGTGAFQAIYTDADDSVVVTTGTITNVSGSTLTGNTTQIVYSGTVTVNAKASSNIQFTFGYTSVGATTMQYNLHVRCEQI